MHKCYHWTLLSAICHHNAASFLFPKRAPLSSQMWTQPYSQLLCFLHTIHRRNLNSVCLYSSPLMPGRPFTFMLWTFSKRWPNICFWVNYSFCEITYVRWTLNTSTDRWEDPIYSPVRIGGGHHRETTPDVSLTRLLFTLTLEASAWLPRRPSPGTTRT